MVFGDELIVIERGGLEVVVLHVVLGDLDCRVVAERRIPGSGRAA